MAEGIGGSAPAASQGDAGQQGEGQADGGQSLDPSQIAQQFEGFQQGQEELRGQLSQLGEFLQSQPWQQQPEPQQQPQGFEQTPEFAQFADQLGADPQEMAQQLAPLFDQHVQQAVQQYVGPVAEQLDDMRRTQAARDLTEEFPDLNDPQNAQEVIELSSQYAKVLSNGDQNVERMLASNPALWKLIVLGGKAYDAQKAEGAETPQAAHLEGSGGQGPGNAQQGGDAWKQQVFGPQSERGAGVLPF